MTEFSERFCVNVNGKGVLELNVNQHKICMKRQVLVSEKYAKKLIISEYG